MKTDHTDLTQMSLAELHEERHRIEKDLAENGAELAKLDATIESCCAFLVEEGARRVVEGWKPHQIGYDRTPSPRMTDLVFDGLTKPAARVLEVIERDPESYFGKDLLEDRLWELLARRKWRGATEQTVKQVFARAVAEAAATRTEDKSIDQSMDVIAKAASLPESQKQALASVFKDRGSDKSARSARQPIVRESEVLWSDSMLMEMGVQLWNETYKHGADDNEVRARCAQVGTNWATGDLTPGENNRGPNRQLLVEEMLLFTAKWAVHAFQRITTAHTYAAALMCSDADRDSLESIETQWHAFLVQVPSGMLTVRDADGRVVDYNRVLVTQSEYGASIITLDQQNNHPARIVVERSTNLADLLARGENETARVMSGSISDPTLRAIVLAKRLVAGLLLAMQHADNFKAKTYPAKERKRDGRKREEPAHRVVFVGKPIQVDCRPAVSDYIVNGPPRKGSGPPSVQHVVRGHYKRQVVGIGRNGRKTIWIEPYWRGPDGAPIFTHPKKVGGAFKEKGTA